MKKENNQNDSLSGEKDGVKEKADEFSDLLLPNEKLYKNDVIKDPLRDFLDSIDEETIKKIEEEHRGRGNLTKEEIEELKKEFHEGDDGLDQAIENFWKNLLREGRPNSESDK